MRKTSRSRKATDDRPPSLLESTAADSTPAPDLVPLVLTPEDKILGVSAADLYRFQELTRPRITNPFEPGVEIATSLFLLLELSETFLEYIQRNRLERIAPFHAREFERLLSDPLLREWSLAMRSLKKPDDRI